MTEKGEQIHAFWHTLVAMNVVLGGMTRRKAEKEAYKVIEEEYGEETLIKEFEINKDGKRI